MAKTTYASVEDYLAAQPDASREILARVRAAIRKAIPKAEETISYQIPTYKIDGVMAIYFAGWKEHFSIYPATQALLASLGDDLAPYAVAKGTIRFDFTDRVPVGLIGRIARHRANEIAAKARAKADASKRPRAQKAAKKTAKKGRTR
jgi:uncharacterized protein YdhG (YjbR/CyaY superfamily)